MRISDWSSDVCSSDLRGLQRRRSLLHGGHFAACPLHPLFEFRGIGAKGDAQRPDLSRHASPFMLIAAQTRIAARISSPVCSLGVAVFSSRPRKRESDGKIGRAWWRESGGQNVYITAVVEVYKNKQK